ncbi:ferrochelatase [Brevibacterium sp. 50QC2O2]|jgi:ferrochelatase|uniref:ferrochelatase n=1 Tax=Brevibacterium TaxID=1696 RepID=UPI00211BE968|nr:MULTISPECIES: ferrochelatase [unclassified Brevibacterium]MCQ9366994.1 ferrochelatase [Brevibacterium sp. 91QC2O2]MCQ9384143.1 ferrochelatase [Brevibacterium sp. 68QC2CO]MCQ9388379.1 ferrochelatase [Brevibacterium sp. 50QC2O2]
MTESLLSPYDAVVLVSFGGPEKPDDVLPFLKNVTRGRGIPDARLEVVGAHYYGFGGKSPINDQNRALLAALRAELDSRSISTPLLWGNRNWEPYLPDALREHSRATGAKRYLAILTSAYSSYSSVWQYYDYFAKTREELASEGIEVEIDAIRQYFNHPGFADTEVDIVRSGLAALDRQVGGLDPQHHRLLYVTHSIPDPMEAESETRSHGYLHQHEELIDYVAEQLSDELTLPTELVFCSRSGAPGSPWLEPDINDRLRELSAQGVTGVVAVPIGFVSDHMEVKYDLDTEAAQTAAELGLDYHRAATVSTSPGFVAGLVDLLEERAAQASGKSPERPAVTPQGPLDGGDGEPWRAA